MLTGIQFQLMKCCPWSRKTSNKLLTRLHFLWLRKVTGVAWKLGWRISITVNPAIADRSEGFSHCIAPPFLFLFLFSCFCFSFSFGFFLCCFSLFFLFFLFFYFIFSFFSFFHFSFFHFCRFFSFFHFFSFLRQAK